MKNITNIHVDSVSGWHNGTQNGTMHYAIGWQDEIARYHVWSYSLGKSPTIFKNPLPGAPEFNTRSLDSRAAANARVLDHVLSVVNRDQLVEKAIAEYQANEQRDHTERMTTIARKQLAQQTLDRIHEWRTMHPTNGYTLTVDEIHALLIYRNE